MEEGNLTLEKGKSYFIQEALGKDKKHTRLFLSDDLRETIKEIVNEEDFSSTIVINQEELESRVGFIMSEICDVILEKKYKLVISESETLLRSPEESLISVKRESDDSPNPPQIDNKLKEDADFS